MVPAKILKCAPLAAAFLLASCAGQVPPGGGPIDTVPPAILRTVPDTNAVRVPTSTQSLDLEFSEYVDRRSVEESIFISPYLGDLEFDWGATEVSIRFSDSLRKNTTYVVNIGTDVRDTRANNRMAQGYTLAFSTGDSIDQGMISGRVFDEKPEGVMIFAYRLDGIRSDTLDPSHTRPEYIMQSGKAGIWTLSNIALGRYRVIAVRDEYRNMLYDPGIDAYGVSFTDLLIDSSAPRMRDIAFRLTRQDTVRPFLSSARAANRYELQLRFSEALDSLAFASASFEVRDTLKGTAIPTELSFLARSDRAAAGLLLAQPMDSAAAYRVRARGVRDVAGNLIDSSHAYADFQGSNRPDTLKPRLNFPALRDSVRDIWIEQPVEIDFSKPVVHEPIARAAVLLDSARKPVDVNAVWLSATDLVLVPRMPFASRAWYQFRLVMDSVRDYHGFRYKDSTLVIRFQTIDLRVTGVMSGSVVDAQGEKGRGPIYLTASSIDLPTRRTRTLRMNSPGRFLLEKLVEGKYVLDAYRDTDSSGTYTYGEPYPYVPSERFVVYRDTVKVRARWTVEGVQLTLP
jgi:hypothetical protein